MLEAGEISTWANKSSNLGQDWTMYSARAVTDQRGLITNTNVDQIVH